MYYIKVTEGKNEKLKKEGNMRISISIFIYKKTLCTQNLKTLAPIGVGKSVTEISIGEKEK